MAPLPHNNTALYFVDYTTVGLQHTMEVRANANTSPGVFGTIMQGFLTQLNTLVFAATVSGVRFQAIGQNVSNPVVTGMEGFTFGSDAGTVDSAPIALNFVGRSPGGRRVRLMVFSYKAAFSTYRLTIAENNGIGAAVTILNGEANTFLAIDGQAPVWYPYANVLVNAYWQRAVRA